MKGRYNVYSYAHLLMAVHRAARRTKVAKRHPFVDCLTMLLCSALSFEAFLNHLGPRIFPHWSPLKRKLSPREKLEILAAAKGVVIDWSRRPYQSLDQVMIFRNLVVHAESSTVGMEVIAGTSRLHKAHWPSYCELDTATRISRTLKGSSTSFPMRLA